LLQLQSVSVAIPSGFELVITFARLSVCDGRPPLCDILPNA
jgi:hypothetical protein